MSIKQCLNFDGLESTGISRSLYQHVPNALVNILPQKYSTIRPGPFDGLKLALHQITWLFVRIYL